MMAALLTGIPSRQLQLTDLGSPRPGPGEALVAVRACGICGTDLHIMAGESYRPELPFVLGHEFMGTVLEGPGATQDWAGARVVPTLFSGCGLCEACRDGEERLCSSGPTIVGVLGRPGGFAAQVVVPYRHLLRVPEAMPDEVAAALVDAGTTACNAARLAMQARSYGDPRYLVLGGARRPSGLRGVEGEGAAHRRSRTEPGAPRRTSGPGVHRGALFATRSRQVHECYRLRGSPLPVRPRARTIAATRPLSLRRLQCRAGHRPGSPGPLRARNKRRPLWRPG